MKAKHLFVGTVVAVAVGGLWFGSTAWRTDRQRVTLDVRNVPLAEVLRRVERQTGKRIRAESSVDARVTLRVVDQPLSKVLDSLGEQAGAHWSTVYAVYDSARALGALESALGGNGKLESAGWTKLAPKLDNALPPDPSDLRPVDAQPFPRPDADSGGAAPAPGHPTVLMMARRLDDGPEGPVLFIGGSDTQREVWSPEELVIESPLTPRLGSAPAPRPTAKAAEETAQKVHGHWTTCLAFRKSSLGVGRVPFGRPGTALALPAPSDRFSRLTPEQRVQQARGPRGADGQ